MVSDDSNEATGSCWQHLPWKPDDGRYESAGDLRRTVIVISLGLIWLTCTSSGKFFRLLAVRSEYGVSD